MNTEISYAENFVIHDKRMYADVKWSMPGGEADCEDLPDDD